MFKFKTENLKRKVTVQSLKFLVLNFSFALCTLHFALCTAFAQPVSSAELINNAKEYDGKTVVYQGEVIGEIMRRGEFAWLNVLEGTAAIGVFCPTSLISEIKFLGSYKFKGDIISVEGTFQRNCLQHGADLDIHAEKVTLLERGKASFCPLESTKVKIVLILLMIILILFITHLAGRRSR